KRYPSSSAYSPGCRRRTRADCAAPPCRASRPSERLHEFEHFLGVPRHLHAAPLFRELAGAIDDERAPLDSAHFLAVHVFHFDDAERAAELLIGIGEVRERKAHLRLEAI